MVIKMRQFRLGRDSFYYGAVLSCIMEHNKNLIIDLIRCKSNVKVYRIRTQQSMECIAMFKTGCEKSPGSKSWLCRITDADRVIFSECRRLGLPLLQYILCPNENLYESDIAVLRYDEIYQTMRKKSFTISIPSPPNTKHGFMLHRVAAMNNVKYLPKNRITRNLNEMIREVIAASNGQLKRRFPKSCMFDGYELVSLFVDEL